MLINASTRGRRPWLHVSPAAAGAILAVGTALGGCKSTTVIDEQRITPTHIGIGDAIVVLGRRTGADHETEYDFINCVGQSLGGGKGAFLVIPEKQFVDTMYPYFESSTAPTDVKNLEKIVAVPEVAQKFNDFHVRYFVWIDGSTETTDKQGSITCSFGPGGGCFGFATWDDKADYEASIWDFKELSLTGKINAETKGTSYLPAIVIPIPLLARVQSHACTAMADQIKSFLQ